MATREEELKDRNKKKKKKSEMQKYRARNKDRGTEEGIRDRKGSQGGKNE